jgi:glycerophosphoryl diester phosphodiesterase
VLGNYGGSGDDDIGNIGLVPPAFGGNCVANRDLVIFDCGRDDNKNSAVSVLNRENGQITTLWNSGSSVDTIRGGTSRYDGYAYFADYSMPSENGKPYIYRIKGDRACERVFLDIDAAKLPRLDSAIAINPVDGSIWLAVNDGDVRNVFRVDAAHAVWQGGNDYLASVEREIGNLGYDVANYSMASSPDGKLLAVGNDEGIDKIYLYKIVPTIDIDTRLGKIISNFRNAYNGQIMIAAHRGDHKNFPENSLEGMVSAAKLGADIVEVDIQKTKDGVLVLSHDKTLDRATNGSGEISKLTFSEIQKFFLKNPDGNISNLKVPTLRSVMLAMNGKAMIMLDKSFNHFDDCLALSRELGVTDQLIFKNSKPLDEMEIVLKKNPDVYYGFGIEDKKKNYINLYIQCIKQLQPQMLEISYRKETSWFLSDEARRLARSYNVRIWNNGLDRPTWCNAGHCDSKALTDPDGNWGWQIKQGVGIIQTDEIEALRKYLSSLGRHD